VSNAKIFLLANDALTLHAMAESGYVTELELQQLLARFCDLLPEDQIDPEEPRRWLFVGREVGVRGRPRRRRVVEPRSPVH
jgi:hypothetical protein